MTKDMTPYHPRAQKFLSDKTFTKAKYLARHLDVSRSNAGKLLRTLGWTVWGSKTCTNKTFVRPK